MGVERVAARRRRRRRCLLLVFRCLNPSLLSARPFQVEAVNDPGARVEEIFHHDKVLNRRVRLRHSPPLETCCARGTQRETRRRAVVDNSKQNN